MRAGVLLEKVIRKNNEMFRHKTSMRKPFFSKSTCNSLKTNFSIYFFLQNFKKCTEKKQRPSEKLLAGLVSMNIFTDTF